MTTASEPALYPDPQPHNYEISIPMTTKETEVSEVPEVPEVQHHDTNSIRDDESELDVVDHKSPGDVPSRYLNLEFTATFHEHKKTSLIKPVHAVLGIIYKWIKIITYHIFVFVIGIPLMIIWALLNGIMAFIYSWIWSPTLRITIFWIAAILPLVTMPLVTIFRPLIDVAARCLSKIRCKAGVDGKGFVQNAVQNV